MIKTKRLTVRRVGPDDWKAIKDIWAGVAATEYARYDRPNDTDDDSVLKRVEKWSYFRDSKEHVFCAVCLGDTVIGYIALNRREDGYEIGYCFHPDYYGKGYARESIAGLLNAFGAKCDTRITAGTALDNIPSVRLLRSLGFRQTGTEKVSFYKDESGEDIVFDGGIFQLDLKELKKRTVTNGEGENERETR